MRTLTTLVLSCFLATPALAQAPAEKKDEKAPPPPSVTEHEVVIGGQPVKYKATAGSIPLMDDNLKPKANVFYVAYEKQGVEDVAARPVTFAFNGGPGSSSVWLHLGALGPRRVSFGPEGETLPPPGKLVDNEFSWLDLTDLVFVDPVSTGYSRAVEGEDPHQFHGLSEDIRAVGDFIRLYCTRNNRWTSPKYLAGESYGTTRASGLASDLQGRLGIYVNGIVLVSPVLDFQTISFDAGNDTVYWLFLPTYTATAFYHGKLKPPLNADLTRTLAEAEAWAQSDYLEALALGDGLQGDRREQIAAKLAAYTGLSLDYVKRANLRPTIYGFANELLREEGLMVGRFDSRYKGIDRNGVGGSPDYDPSYSAVQGVFTAGLNSYVRGELKYDSDLNYEILTGRVHPWRFGDDNGYANVSDSLRSAMVQNPFLRVMAASGYYDLATPHFAMTYTISHLGLPAIYRDHITQEFYGAGHMMYLRQADLKKFKEDAAKFYTAPR